MRVLFGESGKPLTRRWISVCATRLAACLRQLDRADDATAIDAGPTTLEEAHAVPPCTVRQASRSGRIWWILQGEARSIVAVRAQAIGTSLVAVSSATAVPPPCTPLL
jgi:hypothetical protein